MKNWKKCFIAAGFLLLSIFTTANLTAAIKETPAPSVDALNPTPTAIVVKPTPTLVIKPTPAPSSLPVETAKPTGTEPVVKTLGYEESVLIVGIRLDLNSVEDTMEVEKIIKKYEKDKYEIERVLEPVKKLTKLSIDKDPTNVLTDADYKELSEKQKRIFAAYKIKFNKPEKEIKAIEKLLKKDPGLEYVQSNYYYQTTFNPNDPEYTAGNLWGLTSTKTNLAWDSTQGDNIIVAIVDSGVDYNHPDLVGNLWSNGQGACGYDFSDIDTDPMDYEMHGTHVAGTVAALINNSLGVVGVAPHAKIMAVKVFPNATSSVLAEGLRYAADNGATVINNSWGPRYRRPDDALVNAAIEYAYSQGCVVVFSAGNANDDTQYYFGANHPHAISVASVNSSFAKAPTSNWGSIVKIAAPGESIKSLQPGGLYQYMSGTSMAAPHISGLAALIKAKYPSYTNDQISNRITASASVLSIPEIPNAGFMDSNSAVTDSTPPPSPVPIINDIPAVVEGENITVNGLNFVPSLSQVVITGNGINEYGEILTCTATEIRFINKYNYGIYQVQVQNGIEVSNWATLTINQAPEGETPEIGVLPVVEEQEVISIYGNKYDTSKLQVKVVGNGVDDYAVITYSCRTAIKISNVYTAGTYSITVYNGKTPSTPKTLTIYTVGNKPPVTYTTINGNSMDNWLNGNLLNNKIYGFAGCDTITGREGNDLLYGGDDDDTYVYGIGHGLDTIDDTSGNDLVVLMNINPNDVTTAREGDDYIIYVPNGQIIIKNQFTTSTVETLAYW